MGAQCASKAGVSVASASQVRWCFQLTGLHHLHTQLLCAEKVAHHYEGQEGWAVEATCGGCEATSTSLGDALNIPFQFKAPYQLFPLQVSPNEKTRSAPPPPVVALTRGAGCAPEYRLRACEHICSA